jgi:phosphatidate cytidylyltransferase
LVNFLQGAGEEKKLSDAPDSNNKNNAQTHADGLRWLTALIAMPIVLALVWFGGWVAFAGAAFVVALGTFELDQMMRHAGYRPLIWVSLGLSLLFLVAAMLPSQSTLLLETALGAALLISFPLLFLRKRLDGALVDWSLTLAIAVYLGWPMSLFLVLRGYQAAVIHPAGGGWLWLPAGVWWLLTVFLGVWGFDGAAFFVGRSFGRHRLAPKISPAKSWEGVIGGLVLSIVASLLFTVVPLGVAWYLAIVLGLLIGGAAVLGDLAESLIKRQTNVKDSGQFMPGHGGILDRVDSLLFAVIVVAAFAHLIGK